MTDFHLSRRGFLGVAAAISAAPLLGACGPTGGGSTKPTGNGAVAAALPDYIPLSLTSPDLPGDGAAIQDGYYRYPYEDAVRSVTKKPGSGGKVSFLTLTFGSIGTPLAQNQYWQAVNEELGIEYDVQTTLADSFLQKVQTTVAGGDIPDLVTFSSGFPIPQTPALLAAKFTELSEYVSGSAIEKYPNLANIPSQAWRGTVFNGGIYGVPCARPTAGAPINAYQDMFDAIGITEAPRSLQELREALKEVTNEGGSLWGVPNPFAALFYGRFGYGAPNVWAESGGKFTNEIETDEYLAALEWAASVHRDGSMHPDGITIEDGNRLFASKNVATTIGSATGWPGVFTGAAKSGSTLSAWVAPAAGEQQAVLYAGSGLGFFTAFTKADDPELIKERLRIANWIASPFGTQEDRLLKFGIEGVHHELVNGAPVTNDLFGEERGIAFGYTANGPIPQLNVANPESTDVIHTFQTTTKDMLVDDASLGLYSETAPTKNATLQTMITTAVNDIVLGRKDATYWTDEVVPQWRSGGGDTIRGEYEKSLASR